MGSGPVPVGSENTRNFSAVPMRSLDPTAPRPDHWRGIDQSPLNGLKQSRASTADRAVAILDILGFQARMQEEDPQTLFAQTLGELPRIIATSAELVDAPEIRAAQFSDTIFLWTTVEGEPGVSQRVDPKDCVHTICTATVGLMHRCVRKGIFLRGAIAFGKCFISERPPAFVGKPIASAVTLERRQQWSGVALDDSAEAILEYDMHWSIGVQNFVRYLVPMKVPPDEVRVVIKWPAGMHLPDPLQLMRPRTGSLLPDVEAKIIHTMAFFETFRNRFGYPDGRPTPIPMVNGEIGELADMAKAADPIDWHASTLSRLR